LPLLKGSHGCALCLALPDDFEHRFQNWYGRATMAGGPAADRRARATGKGGKQPDWSTSIKRASGFADQGHPAPSSGGMHPSFLWARAFCMAVTKENGPYDSYAR
jgi:hypothetical protein